MEYEDFLAFYKSERFKAFIKAVKNLTDKKRNPTLIENIEDCRFEKKINEYSETERNNFTANQRMKLIYDDVKKLSEKDIEAENDGFSYAREEQMIKKFSAYCDMVKYAENFENEYKSKNPVGAEEKLFINNAHIITAETVSLNNYARIVYGNFQIEADKDEYYKARESYFEAQGKLKNAVNFHIAENRGDSEINIGIVATALKNECVDLTHRARIFEVKREKLDASFERLKTKGNKAFDKEITDLSKREDECLKKLTESKSIFGFESAAFKRVKENARELIDMKQGSADAMTQKKQTDKLADALNDYVKANDRTKITNEGRLRLDTAKNLLSLVENKSLIENAYKSDFYSFEKKYNSEEIKPISGLEKKFLEASGRVRSEKTKSKDITDKKIPREKKNEAPVREQENGSLHF